MDKTIATFKKNKFQEIRIGIREFKGNDLVDIRTWTKPIIDYKQTQAK